MKNKQAFSIVEVIVVIVIMGVLAAMAIPNYIVGLSRTTARVALDNLVSIQNAQLVYVQANNAYYASSSVPGDDTANINSKLNLNITPMDVSYYCDSSSICHATKSGTGEFDIRLDLKAPINKVGHDLVYCDSGGMSITYNPCCLIPSGGGQVSGAICP